MEYIIMFNNWTGYSRVCVPRVLVHEVLKEIHDGITGTAHAGYEKTYKRVAQIFYWPRMSTDIKKFVYSCPICQQIKHRRHAPYGVLKPIPIPDKPFEVVTMDLITDLPESKGYNAIYVIVCKLTKYAFFIPCTTKLSEKESARLFFNTVVCQVGLPIQIISDRIPHEYDIHPVISIAHLEKYTQSPEEFGEREELEPLRRHQKTTEEYEVLEIVDECKIKKRGRYYKEYKCNWKGHGITDEWIPEKNLRNAQELLQEWIQKKAKNHRRK
jgi:hypothetical protein